MKSSKTSTPPSCTDEFDPTSLNVDEALSRIDQSIVSVEDYQQISITDMLDRVLAEDIHSPINVPPYINSAMDGYALNSNALTNDGDIILKLAGTVYAGTPLNGPVPNGYCARIMTGGKMPEGTDTVVMQEHVRIDGDKIIIGANHKPGQNVRHAGEDITQGALVLERGKRLTAADIGLLASLGIESVNSKRLLNVAMFSTGDELVPLGTPLQAGQIYDSNRYTLAAMLKRFGANVLNYGVIKDNRDDIENAFTEAATKADVLITTGGVSVGDADFVKQTLDKLGEVSFWKIAMKPGRPLAYGKLNNCYFFGLPGNPVSTMVTFYQFVLPALKKLQGETTKDYLTLKLRCTTSIRKNPGRVEYQRGIMEYDDNGELVVRSTGGQGSHMLSSMAKANCFIILPMDCNYVEAGETVVVQPFSGII